MLKASNAAADPGPMKAAAKVSVRGGDVPARCMQVEIERRAVASLEHELELAQARVSHATP